MWTPRRVLLLLGGLLIFGAVYGFYSRLLGWLDGLPQLPAPMLEAASADGPRPAPRTILPTIQRIREAFGPDCLEQHTSYYRTQLEFMNLDGTSTVLACGPPQRTQNSNRMELSPFSIASFGAPKPKRLRSPGETVEISTFHADKAVLEFDRPVNGPVDMGKAKLLRMELISEPDPARVKFDRRSGLIYITNNQRSEDPGRFLVIRTVGPLFYRDPKSIDLKGQPGAAAGPDIWTDAPVEIVDRQNLPRRFSGQAARERFRTFAIATNLALRAKGENVVEPETTPAKGPDLQSAEAVREVLMGQRLPPPTISAIGMKVFFEPPGAKKDEKKNSAGIGGVRRVELQEKVLVNLWVDSRQGLVETQSSNTGTPAPAPPEGSVRPTPAPATVAVAGGLLIAAEYIHPLNRALLQVDTLGRLTYETATSTAHFDVLPDGNPDLPNDVQVHRVQPLDPGLQRLFSQFLEIEFYGQPVGGSAKTAANAAEPSPAPPKVPAKPAPAAGTFKQLRAWVDQPNRFVVLASATDRLESYSQYLLHDKESATTTLRGIPLTVVRQNETRTDGKRAGGNKLIAGNPQQPAVLTLKPAPKRDRSPKNFEGPKPENGIDVSVDGPGRLELFDPGSEENTIHAVWQTRMTATREMKDERRELGLYTFIDGAMFEDKRTDYWLKGQTIRLWMEPKSEKSDGGPDAGGSVPHRLLAADDGKTEEFTVSSHAGDFDIDSAKTLDVFFQDGVPPLQTVAAAPPAPPPLPPAGPPMPNSAPMAPKPAPIAEPKKPKPPMRVIARKIQLEMIRYPLVEPPQPMAVKKNDDAAEAKSTLKYELRTAVCEGNVEVHQDPAEPDRDKRGTDIKGRILVVDHTPDGSVMTVTALDDQHPGEVHNDGVSIIGPKIVLDQIKNQANVEGRGSLKMPSTTNLNGGELKKASVVVIHWRDKMEFDGALKRAQFFGKVTAEQNDSSVECHWMDVHFDRPINFSRRPNATASKPPPKGKEPKSESPKIDWVYCAHAPDDQREEAKTAFRVRYRDVSRDESGRIVKTQYLDARSLELRARAIDPASRESYQKVHAMGPGELRIWQSGLKDDADPAGPAPGMLTGARGTGAAPRETDKKLTLVIFSNEMIGRDFGNRYQDATFTKAIRLFHCPAGSDNFAFDENNLPAGSVRLQCIDKLVVSSHKVPKGQAQQRLDAYGNAYFRSDEYDGWGELITSDGPTVTLIGSANARAWIKSRFSANGTDGTRIVFDRKTGSYSSNGSTKSIFQQAPKK